MKMKSKIALILVVALFGASGCIGFKLKKIPELPVDKTIRAEAKHRPEFRYIFGYYYRGRDVSHSQDATSREFAEAVRQMGYQPHRIAVADQSKDDQAQKAFRFKLENHSTVSGIVAAIISGISLLTIPSFGTDYMQVSAFRPGNAGAKPDASVKDGIFHVFWLPLIVAMPFKSYGSVYRDIRQNMYRTVISKLQADKFLARPAAKANTGAQEATDKISP